MIRIKIEIPKNVPVTFSINEFTNGEDLAPFHPHSLQYHVFSKNKEMFPNLKQSKQEEAVEQLSDFTLVYICSVFGQPVLTVYFVSSNVKAEAITPTSRIS